MGIVLPGDEGLCEVQGYGYAAKRAAARLFAGFGDRQRAEALEQQAGTSSFFTVLICPKAFLSSGFETCASPDSRVDLSFERQAGTVRAEILEKQGDVEVVFT
ncbi:MAG TPA: hypothetical protein VEI49_04770 [Terriglobales bacterium]|nr:hypothetical protein [Terriglobales bacterium]